MLRMTVKQLENFLHFWGAHWNWPKNNRQKVISMFQIPYEPKKHWVHTYEISPNIISGELSILSLFFPRAGVVADYTHHEVNAYRLINFSLMHDQFAVHTSKKKEVLRLFSSNCQWPIQLAVSLSFQGVLDKIKIYASFNNRLKEGQSGHAWEFIQVLAKILQISPTSYQMFMDYSLDSVGLAVSRDNSWQLKIYPFWHQNFRIDNLIKPLSRFIPNSKLRGIISSKTLFNLEDLCTRFTVADIGLNLRLEKKKLPKSWKVWIRYSPPLDPSVINSKTLRNDETISQYFAQNSLSVSYMTWENNRIGIYAR